MRSMIPFGGGFPLQFSSTQDKGGEKKYNLQNIARKHGASGKRTAISVNVWIKTWRQEHAL